MVCRGGAMHGNKPPALHKADLGGVGLWGGVQWAGPNPTRGRGHAEEGWIEAEAGA